VDDEHVETRPLLFLTTAELRAMAELADEFRSRASGRTERKQMMSGVRLSLGDQDLVAGEAGSHRS
jgi:hypothetical protein